MEVNLKTGIFLVILMLTAGCNSGGGSSSSSPAPVVATPWSSFSVVTQADLPTCSGDIVGRLYYVESASNFQVCKSTGWTTVSIQGASGASGITINTITTCSKTTGGATFQHKITAFSTGDKFIYCSISNSLNTYSASTIYKSTQNGATNESCLITYDLDAATSGFWNFSLISGARTAVYSDSGSTSNGVTVTFATSDCLTI